MQPIKLNQFSGLFPRIEPALLPINGATIASNCDFAYGELRSLKDHVLLKTLAESALSIFSEDGLRFYTWPNDANAVISPIGSGEANARLYYTTNGDFRVTARSGATVNGGAPGSSYRVGVPVASIPPVLAVDEAITELAYITPSAKFHYESGGIKYQETDVAITVNVAASGVSYTFTAPERIVSALSGEDRAAEIRDLGYDPYSDALNDPTPNGSIPVLHLIFTSASPVAGEVKLDQYSSASSFAKADDIAITLKQDNILDLPHTPEEIAASKLQFTATLTSTESEKDKSTRAYRYTTVNIYNEEGVPSPAAVVTSSSSSKITVNCNIPPVDQYAPLKELRVYRTQNSGTSAEYFYAFSIPVIGKSGLVSQVDDVDAGLLNEPLTSNYYYPPKPSLQGLINVGNGILAAWFGTELWFSDAYKPWSWPPSYVKSFSWPIVGVETQGSGMLVTTLGNPYAVYGISPDAMTEEKLNVDQAGVSKWSIASVNGLMLYASNDGIVTVRGGQGTLSESQTYFTREVWRERYGNFLGTMQFAEYDGGLLVLSRNNSFTPFLLRTDEGKGSMTELSGLVATSIFYLVTSDGLYFANGRNLYQFGGGLPLSFSWKSKEFRLPRPNGYSIAQAISEGAFSIEFYAKDESESMVLRHTESIAPTEKKKTFRLPSGFISDNWQIKISGTGKFKQIILANSGRQLGGE